MTFKQPFFKFIKNRIQWTIPVSIELIQDNISLFLNLIGRKRGLKRNVRNQLNGPLEVLFREGGIDPRILLGGVSIEFSSHRIQSIQDVKGLSILGPLEQRVLNKVSNTRFSIGRKLIPCAGIDHQPTVSDRSINLLVDDTESIVQLSRMQFFTAPIWEGTVQIGSHGLVAKAELEWYDQNGKSSSSSPEAAIGGTSGNGALDKDGAAGAAGVAPCPGSTRQAFKST